MSQVELAELLNVNQSTVHFWESGKSIPNINQIIVLAYVFNCNLDDFLAPPPPAKIILLDSFLQKVINKNTHLHHLLQSQHLIS